MSTRWYDPDAVASLDGERWTFAQRVRVIGLRRMAGTLVLFDAVDEDGPLVFAADRRASWPIIESLELGDEPSIEIEHWQII